jgi:hypothetical protein
MNQTYLCEAALLFTGLMHSAYKKAQGLRKNLKKTLFAKINQTYRCEAALLFTGLMHQAFKETQGLRKKVRKNFVCEETFE